MEMSEVVKLLIGSGLLTGLVGFVANALGWIRFKTKDKAEVDKIKSESQVDLAEAANKKIDDEVKISKAALEWTVQLAGQLEKANLLTEKRQAEIDRLHTVMQAMREDFEKRMTELENLLQLNQTELDAERKKNKEILEAYNLQNLIKGGAK